MASGKGAGGAPGGGVGRLQSPLHAGKSPPLLGEAPYPKRGASPFPAAGPATVWPVTIGIVILAAVLAALIAAFVVFYRHSHTEAWRAGETRQAALGFLITIAPFFGGRVPPPKPEVPAVLTPGPEQEDIIPTISGRRGEEPGPQADR